MPPLLHQRTYSLRGIFHAYCAILLAGHGKTPMKSVWALDATWLAAGPCLLILS
ncbi:MAG: hypothetical protein ACT4NU_13445 [Chromatiales bacterium]